MSGHIDSISDAAGAPSNLRRKRRAKFADDKLDRLPPHSPEAEQAVLGCIVLEPACLDECRSRFKSPDVFYDLRHQRIYQGMLRINSDTDPVDLISLQQELKRAGHLQECGGLAYLSSLPDSTPSAANLAYYLDIVCEKYQLRRLVETCTDIVTRIYEESDLKLLLDTAERDFARAMEVGKISKAGRTFDYEDLMRFDADSDPDCVIGMKDGRTTSWLCRGQGGWLIGLSSVGKSSLAMLFAVCMALGRDLWGITPRRALRVLFIQAENGTAELAKTMQGISKGLNLEDFENEDCVNSLKLNLKIRSITGKIGQHFCQTLRREIVDHRADLVVLDPFLSFAGIDVGKQDKVSEFLRENLDPVLIETGAVLLSTHHTAKPPKFERGYTPTLLDMAYAGLGSSELVNWARAIMVVQPAGADSGVFKLGMAKRGKEAWATHPDGQLTTLLWLRHAVSGIFWERIEPPQEPEPQKEGKSPGRKSKVDEVAAMNLHGFLASCKADGEGLNDVARRLEVWLAKEGLDVSPSTCKRAIPELVKRGKLTKNGDLLYRKGANA